MPEKGRVRTIAELLDTITNQQVRVRLQHYILNKMLLYVSKESSQCGRILEQHKMAKESKISPHGHTVHVVYTI